ncbi:hypothetical protein EG359_20145 [Chryseobacterium joostei]|uniref:Uncharacterized protein n=1 Tax=Chryseobacterium joostei TaxID=112234 RepID=A0ABM7BR40_9FLAO|nr:hypothetical protein EG359_20145 [Chryseobacterium joostei]
MESFPVIRSNNIYKSKKTHKNCESFVALTVLSSNQFLADTDRILINLIDNFEFYMTSIFLNKQLDRNLISYKRFHAFKSNTLTK